MMDIGGPVQASDDEPMIDLRIFDLPVLTVSDKEMEAHEKVLAMLDKASRRKTIWRVETSGTVNDV